MNLDEIYRIPAKPVVSVFARLGIRPNHVTMLSLLLSVVVALLTATNSLVYAVITYYLMMMMDHVDGQLARKLDLCSAFGAYLDSMIDRVRIPILMGGVLMHVVNGGYGMEGVLLSFWANSVMLVNEMLYIVAKDNSIKASGRMIIKIRENQRLKYFRSILSIDFLGLIHHSIIFMFFLIIEELMMYLYVVAVVGFFQIAIKMARRYFQLQ